MQPTIKIVTQIERYLEKQQLTWACICSESGQDHGVPVEGWSVPSLAVQGCFPLPVGGPVRADQRPIRDHDAVQRAAEGINLADFNRILSLNRNQGFLGWA